MFNFKSYERFKNDYNKISFSFSLLIGSVLGFISGIVGIGGGIFFKSYTFFT